MALHVATRQRQKAEPTERSAVSAADRRRPAVRWLVALIGGTVLVLLFVISVGPLFWLFKASTVTTNEALTQPLALWPSGFHWENYVEAFRRIQFGKYLLNTLWVCLGSWVVTIVVATSAGYVLAILRPPFAKALNAAMLATMLIPGIVSLVGLYLSVVNVPLLNISLINTFWAVWLPAGAGAFNVILTTRFFAALPREIFEAAEVDGAGAFRILWSIVLPLSKPVLGVLSLFAIVAAYKDFLWPKLVLMAEDLQPLSVALPRLESSTQLSVFLAAMFASVVVPLAVFLLFQKQFLSAAGSQGAIKG